jgi:tRNA G18 (ribose-2'-O)-methylase SpoU
MPTAGDTPITLLLYGLQSPINIGMILRVAETYQAGVALFDSAGVMSDQGKMKTVSDFACGALERRGYELIDGDRAFDEFASGRRLIATSIERDAQALPGFRFEPRDVVIVGNEYDGLPEKLMGACQSSLYIPMADVWTPKPPSHSPIDAARSAPVAREGKPSLNVAVASAIVCYAHFTGRAR